jgi:hypothetical protein
MREILLSARDRTALRRRVRLPCQVVEEASFSLLAREALDLSPDGMCVRALLPAAVGTRVLASFRIPGSSLYIDTEAEVTRIIWGRRAADRSSGLGLRFLGLSRVDRAILTSRLNGLPPPVPTRSLRFDYARSVSAFSALFSRASTALAPA